MLKKIFGGIAIVFSILLGLFLREKSKRLEAESKVENAEYNTSNEVLKVKLDNLDKDQKAALAIHEVEKNRKLTDEEMLEFLNGK